MAWLAGALSLILAPTAPQPARADGPPSARSYPERARALWPTGSAGASTVVDVEITRGETDGRDPAVPAGTHYERVFRRLITHTGWARVPLDSAVLSVRYAGLVQWVESAPSDELVVLRGGNPELGVAFFDAPAPGWRYELGGALTVPAATQTVVDGSEPRGASLFPTLPPAAALGWHSLGWDAHLVAIDTLAVVARGRIAWDPLAELALGVDVASVLHVPLSGGPFVVAQVALQVAGRIDGAQLVGLRAELTTYSVETWVPSEVNVLLESFVRLAATNIAPGAFVRMALRLPLGPAFPFATQSPFGYLGASLAGGVLY